MAHTVSVFKKGNAGDLINYRPISLTCVPSKIMERIITSRMLNHLYLNNILCSAQHGFLRRRSTSTNLLECFNDCSVCVQSRQQVAIVYIDFVKAFDVVSHKKLFAQLYSLLMVCVKPFYCGYKIFLVYVLIKQKLVHTSQTQQL